MLVIVNPAAAGGRARRDWPRVERVLRELGHQPPHVFTEAPGHATELAARAVGDGAQVVVVVGGDGTACEAAEGLYRAGRGALAMLPLGTGNDAARTLGIPLREEDAIRVAFGSGRRRVDLIKVADRVVLNAIGIGLLADINQRAARFKRVRGITVYAATALVSLFRYRTPRIRVRIPNQSYAGSMTILAVHNGPSTGGGFRLTPKAQPCDGMLDACLVRGVGPLGRLPRLVAAMRGTLASQRLSLELQAPFLELEFDQPLPLHLDGNQSVLEPPSARFEVLPEALEMVVPE